MYEESNFLSYEKVVISVQQRNSRQYITYIEGLNDDLDIQRIAKHIGKKLHCNTNVIKNNDNKDIIRLSGNQRQGCYDFLIQMEICNSENIIIKGA
jgi:translation initiation factor SUI1